MKKLALLAIAALLMTGVHTTTTANARGLSWEKTQTERSTEWAGRGPIAKKCCV